MSQQDSEQLARLKALAADSLMVARKMADRAAADDEVVNTLFEEQWALLEDHVSYPDTVHVEFWAIMSGRVSRRVAERVKQRFEALGVQCRWETCYCNRFRIHPSQWLK